MNAKGAASQAEQGGARPGNVALILAAVSLACLVITQLSQVLGRYLFNETPGWTETVSILLMNSAMMFGAAAGVRAGAHFGFTLGVDHLPATLAIGVRALREALVALLGAALSWLGLYLVLDTWPVKAAGAPLPQGLAYAPLFLGGALIALFALVRGVSILRGRSP